MAIIQGNAKQGSTRGFYPKLINGSLRFNPAENTYLAYTMSSASSTYTVSMWIKRCGITSSSYQYLFSSGNAGLAIAGTAGTVDQLYVYNGASVQYATPKLRDPSAWYHLVLSVNAGSYTLYLNGESIGTGSAASFSTTTNATRIGRYYNSGNDDSTNYVFDGYIANFYLIDGQALTASDFGETKNGVWVAKDYAGTYGTNGFYLTFEDDTAVEAFNTVLYTGDGTSNRPVTGLGFQPDLVWIKRRDTTDNNVLKDVVRGVTSTLVSDTGLPASNYGANYNLTSFDSDGFTTTSGAFVNGSGKSYVAWGWKAGDSDVSNTDGSITSTVRANPTYGFSIVQWEGTGANGSVGHGLGVAPKFIIAKNVDASANWFIYHDYIGANGYIMLNQTNAGDFANSTVWQNVPPDTDKFYVSTGGMNYYTSTIIAYCWAETAGYSKFGNYSGDSTTDGSHEINVGFKPALVLIKHARDNAGSYSGDWFMYDNTRDTYNGDSYLRPNLSNGETANGGMLKLTDTGFAFYTNSGSHNETNNDYIYAAFADTREAAFWLDQSGNDNNWQPVNLDHNDTVADSPTDNFATLNPLDISSPTVLSDGNLTFTGTATGWRSTKATMMPTSGQWYCECTMNYAAPASTDRFGVGICREDYLNTYYLGQTADSWCYFDNGQVWNNGANTGTVSAIAIGDVIGIALDMDANTVSWYKNGTLIVTKSIASGTWVFAGTHYDIGKGTFNFGQQPFKYDPPA